MTDIPQEGVTPPEAPAGKLDMGRVGPIFALVFVDVLGLTIILPLLHLYAVAYGASPEQIGLIAASFPLAQLIGVPVMGALSDRFGRKPLLLISQISTCIGFLMLGFANSVEIILLSRVIDGIFGANLATAQAALSDITEGNDRTRALGITGAAFGLGFVFGPVIALITLEVTDNLMIPALVAALYSFISIFLTLFIFRETLPAARRSFSTLKAFNLWETLSIAFRPRLGVLMLLMFAQQVIFYGFETLLGLFTLSRLGLLGQGNSLLFLFIGIVLVWVQVRAIGRWTQKWGESRVILIALTCIGVGLIMLAATPEVPHPFYVQRNAEYDLRQQTVSTTSAEALIGEIAVPLPADGHNGITGIAWMLVALVPLCIGSGLIRPCLNSLMTKRVPREDYGRVLGVSASFVSAANAIAPLIGGVLFQQYGASLPFVLGGGLMLAFVGVAAWTLRDSQTPLPTA